MTTVVTPAPPPRRSFLRFWFPWVVLGLAGLGLAVIWLPVVSWGLADRVFVSLAAGLGTVFLLGLWFVVLCGIGPWWARLGLVAAVVGVVVWSIREVRFSGDMIPTVFFRWTPTPDEVLEAHRRQQAEAGPAPAVEPATQKVADFPAYRGQDRTGVVNGPPLARDWKTHEPRLLWRQPVGGGYAAFAIAGNAAVTIEQRRDQEAVVCYDTATGKERWKYAYPAQFTERLGGPGPRATPTIAGGRVYSLGAAGRLVCLELADGKLVWSVDILQDNENLIWGMSGSPLVYDNKVVVNPGAQTAAAAGRALVAYDRATGKRLWSVGSTRAGYSSPMLATLAGQRQILLLDGDQLGGYDPADGTERWSFSFATYNGINVAQPVVLDGSRVFICAGYGAGCAMLRVSQAEGKWTVETLWKNMAIQGKMSSPVAYQGYLYGLNDGILVGVNQETGKKAWTGRRYGHGQLLLTGDLLLILSEQGELALVEAQPGEFRELGRRKALEGKTWNNPALVLGKLFIRNDEEMACYDVSDPTVTKWP